MTLRSPASKRMLLLPSSISARTASRSISSLPFQVVGARAPVNLASCFLKLLALLYLVASTESKELQEGSRALGSCVLPCCSAALLH